MADGRPGEFDFYVLALTWSPGWCATVDDPPPAECRRAGRGFVVHGLWPQYERGYPRDCASPMSGRVDRSLVAALADIMPDGGLVGHQWRRHGMCSGLSAADYFALVRRALAVVSPPALGADPDRRMTPAAIEAAFAARNLGLSPRGMSVQCRAGALTEVRICLTGDLEFRACAEVDRDACGAGTVRVPPPD